MSKIIFNGVDYAGGSGNYFNPVIYSDVERKIGVWRDNKPLYQKTVNFGSLPANNSSKTVAHGISDIETLANAVFVVQSSTQFRTLPNVSRGNTANQTVWYMTATDIGVLTGSSADVGSAYSGYVTIWYTKTTDVAGSGDYNTLGVPTVHYSTSEQVVGTWTDGKPLYQKTLEFNGSYSGASGNVPINIANLDTVFIFNGWGVNSSNAICPLPYVNNQTTYLGGFFISSDKSNIGIRLGTGITFTKLVFTIQYTKTTD